MHCRTTRTLTRRYAIRTSSGLMGDFGGDERGNRVPHDALSHNDHPNPIGNRLLHDALSHDGYPDTKLCCQGHERMHRQLSGMTIANVSLTTHYSMMATLTRMAIVSFTLHYPMKVTLTGSYAIRSATECTGTFLK